MRGRRRPVALFAVAIAAGVAGCGNGRAGVFHPAGSQSSTRVRSSLPGPRARHLGSFRFPSDVSIDFTSPAPAGAGERGVIAGYQNYALSPRAAVFTRGRNTAYLHDAGGNAQRFDSALRQVDMRTGAPVGPAPPARLTRCLENVAEGRSNDGTWSVTCLASYPAACTQGAMCR